MAENIVIKKSAFEIDAILFTLLGIAIGAFINYKLREKADARLEAKIHDEIGAIKDGINENKKT